MRIFQSVHAHRRHEGLCAEVVEDLELGIDVVDAKVLRQKKIE